MTVLRSWCNMTGFFKTVTKLWIEHLVKVWKRLKKSTKIMSISDIEISGQLIINCYFCVNLINDLINKKTLC